MSPLQDARLARAIGVGDRGNTVKLIQECLCLSRCAVKVDGVFGPATEHATTVFQKKKGLPATGRVEQKTMNELAGPIERAERPIAGDGRSMAQLVVAYARQHLAEHPLEVGGANCGPWVRLYMDGNEGTAWKWCAGFVTHIVRAAADAAGQPMPVKRTFSCDILAADANAKGRLVRDRDVLNGVKAIKPGAVFLIRRTGNDWVHTGLVISVRADTYETIEGNTNDSGDPDGYEVCRRTRAIRNVDFIAV
jgi:hypothetical protein